MVQKYTNLENFAKNISISLLGGVSKSLTMAQLTGTCDIGEDTIFQLPTIKVGEKSLNIFFDSGCGEMVIRKSAVELLEQYGRSNLIAPGPITYSGVGDQKGVCHYGAFSVRLPLKNGGNATLSGICLDKITTDFPKYLLMKISKDIKEICLSNEKMGLYKKLLNLPKKVGGQTDILIGLKYKKYFPQQVLMFPAGLMVYRSVFEGLDGTDGVLGGPHPEITKINNRQVGGDRTGQFCYFATCFDEYRKKSLVACNIPLFGSDKVDKSYDLHLALCRFDSGNGTFLSRKKPLKCIKMFDEAENAGTEISYWCVNCRNCPECKKCPRLNAVTIQEEVEQGIINCSVQVDIVRWVTTAALPFVTNPDLRLEPNEASALKVYKSQAKKLSSRLEEKLAVQQSE